MYKFLIGVVFILSCSYSYSAQEISQTEVNNICYELTDWYDLQGQEEYCEENISLNNIQSTNGYKKVSVILEMEEKEIEAEFTFKNGQIISMR